MANIANFICICVCVYASEKQCVYTKFVYAYTQKYGIYPSEVPTIFGTFHKSNILEMLLVEKCYLGNLVAHLKTAQ